MGYTYRTALVTGASSGVGQACARLLAAEGVSLVIAARRVDRLDALATELVDRYGVGVEVIGADLSDAKDVTRLEERLTEPERPIELLVSNAGFATAGGFAELPVDVSLDAIAVNVIAPVRLIRAALPGMVARGKGGVLVVSSLVASLPMPRSATYGATKAFLSSFSESLYMEARQQGVHVTSVAAGLVRTEFHRTAGINTDGIPDMAWMKPEQVAQAGLDAVAAGKVTVVPGALNKMQVPFFRMAPRALLRRWAKWS